MGDKTTPAPFLGHFGPLGWFYPLEVSLSPLLGNTWSNYSKVWIKGPPQKGEKTLPGRVRVLYRSAGPGPCMRHPPAPPPPTPPGFERPCEAFLCMLPFHQTMHVLSARLAKRGAIPAPVQSQNLSPTYLRIPKPPDTHPPWRYACGSSGSPPHTHPPAEPPQNAPCPHPPPKF